MTPKLSLKNKEHQKSDFLTGFNFWRFKSNPCVITFLSNSKTAYYWVPWDSNDVEAFPSVVLISYARSQRKNHLIKIFTKILILMPKLLEHWLPVDISNQKCSVISIGFVFRSTLILLKYVSTFENQILGPPERILTWWWQVFPNLTVYFPWTTLPPLAV